MNLVDPHLGFEPPITSTTTALIPGSLEYYHYVCDGFDDKGWGCGYRTLQTICSWIKNQQQISENSSISPASVPSILDIQKALVDIGDKSSSFIGSREWIGSIEVSYAIDYFYKVQCRIIHARNINDLKLQADNIVNHFKEFGSPLMMGGDQDCSSKCILGISIGPEKIWLLILDPHSTGQSTREKLQADGWIKWQLIDELVDSSFYNICCPLLKG